MDALIEQGLLAPGAALRRVATGSTWAEGPLWMPRTRRIRWSDIPGDRIVEADPETGETADHRTGVEFTNGRTLGLDGAVVQCSHGRRAVEREDADGTVTTLVDRWEGHRLNSPNDVVVARDGAVWFTDPDYGITQPREGHPGELEYGGRYVFRLDPDGGLHAVIRDMDQPNGLAFSPDESVLYIADSAEGAGGPEGRPHHIRAHRIESGAVTAAWVVAEVAPGAPDGIRVDVEGRIWTSAADGVHVLSPDGAELGRIPVPETVANLCFGGDDGSELFLAATTSVYAIRTATRDAAAR